jgi:uncharacterized protein
MNLTYDRSRLQDLATYWGVRKLAVFGSCSRGSPQAKSDIDLLVEFHPNRKPTLIGHIQLENLLSKVFGRDADLSTLESIQNSGNQRRKDSILENAIEIYCDA